MMRIGGVPSHIFHLAGGSSVSAAIANPREDFARTVATTAELLEWMRLESSSSKLIAVSSAAVYGTGHAGPIREDQALLPFSPYGYHKLMMEHLCQSYGVNYGVQATVVRLFSVYGSHLKKQLLWDMCSRLAAGTEPLELGGTGEELRDWTDIRDVVRALELTMGLPFGEMPIVNAGSGQATSVAKIADLVAKSWPASVKVVFNGKSRPGDPFSLVADDALLRSLGFEWSIPVHTGIDDYVQWYLAHVRSAVE